MILNQSRNPKVPQVTGLLATLAGLTGKCKKMSNWTTPGCNSWIAILVTRAIKELILIHMPAKSMPTIPSYLRLLMVWLVLG